LIALIYTGSFCLYLGMTFIRRGYHMPEKTTMNWNLSDSYTNLPERFYERAEPTAALNPRLVLFNDDLAAELGLNQTELQKKDGIDILSGNAMPIGATSIAQAYAGHQFGQFTILGDGRAIMIGEQLTP